MEPEPAHAEHTQQGNDHDRQDALHDGKPRMTWPSDDPTTCLQTMAQSNEQANMSLLPVVGLGGLLLVNLLVTAAPLAAEPPAPPQLHGYWSGATDNGCTAVSAFYYGVNCSYADGPSPAAGPRLLWVGPLANGVYYPVNSPAATPDHTPEPGDGRHAPALAGSMLIDDRGTSSPTDDLLSGQWIMGPGARSVTSRAPHSARLARIVESWRAIRLSIDAVTATATVTNAADGTDYIIGSRGFPRRICTQTSPPTCFPADNAGSTTDGRWARATWVQPGDSSITRSIGDETNTGAVGHWTLIDYQCRDDQRGMACAGGVGLLATAPGHGPSNLVLYIRTDARGQVTQVEGYWTIEYRIEAGPPALRGETGQPNSWFGGYLHLNTKAEPDSSR